MSHLTVLVIGNDPEIQLEPFDESLRVPEYSNGEVSEKSKASMVEYYTRNGKNPDGLGFDELYAIHGEDWDNGVCRINPETGIWEERSTYNPKSKWDWYQLGGRWSGMLKLKPGKKGELGEKSWGNSGEEIPKGFVDQALKGDIDFDGMRDKAEAECRAEYDRVVGIFGGSIPKVEHLWSTITDKDNPFFSAMTIEEKREFYHNQEAYKEVKKHQSELGWFFELDEFQKSLDELVKEARDKAGQTFAILKDGVWYEKGEMGWWAFVSNEKAEWSSEFSKLLDEIPDDTLMSVYDCHI